MANKIFAVIMDHDRHEEEAIRSLREKDYITYDHQGVILVSSPKAVSKDIADAIGFDSEKSGVVFRLGAGYSGHTFVTLWEWLSDQKDG